MILETLIQAVVRENVKGRLCLLAVEVVRGVVHAAVPVLVLGVELQTKVREHFTITEKASKVSKGEIWMPTLKS